MMGIDYYYIKLFLTPLLTFSISILVMKCCCKCRCFCRSSSREPCRNNNSIYVIPFPVSGNSFDEGSLAPVAVFSPPAYDAVIPIIPPPPYSERKLSDPNEAPPAYTEVAEEPSLISVSPPHT